MEKILNYSTNTQLSQIKVGGWKTVHSQSYTTVKTNGDLVEVSLWGNSFTANAWTNVGSTVPTEYRPLYAMRAFRVIASNTTDTITLDTNGTLSTPVALSNAPIMTSFIYPKK